MIWHSSEIEDVLQQLSVTKDYGLANAVALERLEIYGKNTTSNSDKTSLFRRLLFNSSCDFFVFSWHNL